MKRLFVVGIASLISASCVGTVPINFKERVTDEIPLAVAKIEPRNMEIGGIDILGNEIINSENKVEEVEVKVEEDIIESEVIEEDVQASVEVKQYRERDYIEQIIYDVSNTYQFPELLLQAIIYAESNFNPDCIGPDTYYGNAHGLMQLLPSTAEALGVTDIFNPYQNVDAGTRYMIELMEIYSDEVYYDHLGNIVTPYEMAIIAYNWGYGNLNNHLAMHGVVVIDEDSEYGIPAETYHYLMKIRGYCEEGKLSYEL